MWKYLNRRQKAIRVLICSLARDHIILDIKQLNMFDAIASLFFFDDIFRHEFGQLIKRNYCICSGQWICFIIAFYLIQSRHLYWQLLRSILHILQYLSRHFPLPFLFCWHFLQSHYCIYQKFILFVLAQLFERFYTCIAFPLLIVSLYGLLISTDCIKLLFIIIRL